MALAPAFGVFTFPSRTFAEEMALTPSMTEGPFYPDKMPLDTDNDLIIINKNLTKAIGEITLLGGRILSATGEPIVGANVEIWQVDGNGRYIHTRDAVNGGSDSNFQGYGRCLTGPDGRYYFRTIKPVPYPGRTPHIHFAVSRDAKRCLTTQMLLKGHPQNERDGVFASVRDAAARERILVDLKPVKDSAIGELAGTFDLVIGKTPAEDERGQMRPPGGPGGPGGPPSWRSWISRRSGWARRTRWASSPWWSAAGNEFVSQIGDQDIGDPV